VTTPGSQVGTKERLNLVLVGVAGVGKTTLGEGAERRLGLSFWDVDIGFEALEGADIDTLLARYGDEELDSRLVKYCASKLFRVNSCTIVAAPARVTHYKSFWEAVRTSAIAIHLRGKPLEIYMRQDVWVDGRKLTMEEKLEDPWKQDFYEYYWWRLQHCQKAGHTIRIVGDLRADLKRLCGVIQDLVSTIRPP